jgi:hypothetical protein
MKTSLKNRPKRSDYPSDESGLFHFAKALDEYVEQLEKELTELSVDWQKAKAIPQKEHNQKKFAMAFKKPENRIFMAAAGVKMLAKTLLGETSK